jgi:ATP/maltotriose-dependent transcriptional regulator MalT
LWPTRTFFVATRSLIVMAHRPTMPQDQQEANMRRLRTPEMLAREERQAEPYATLAGFAITHSVKDVFDDRAAQLGNGVSNRLTARECDVLALITQGCSKKRIARTLEISPETARTVKTTASPVQTVAPLSDDSGRQGLPDPPAAAFEKRLVSTRGIGQ